MEQKQVTGMGTNETGDERGVLRQKAGTYRVFEKDGKFHVYQKDKYMVSFDTLAKARVYLDTPVRVKERVR